MACSSEVAKTVAKKLDEYLRVHRAEDAFDLTDAYHPNAAHPQVKPRTAVNIFGPVNSSPRRRSKKEATLRDEINTIKDDTSLSAVEAKARRKLQREMSKNKLKTSGDLISPYAKPLLRYAEHPRVRSWHSTYENTEGKLQRRVGQSASVLRRSPSQKLTRVNRQQLVNMTTKLVMATELPADIMMEEIEELKRERYRPKSAGDIMSDPEIAARTRRKSASKKGKNSSRSLSANSSAKKEFSSTNEETNLRHQQERFHSTPSIPGAHPTTTALQKYRSSESINKDQPIRHEHTSHQPIADEHTSAAFQPHPPTKAASRSLPTLVDLTDDENEDFYMITPREGWTKQTEGSNGISTQTPPPTEQIADPNETKPIVHEPVQQVVNIDEGNTSVTTGSLVENSVIEGESLIEKPTDMAAVEGRKTSAVKGTKKAPKKEKLLNYQLFIATGNKLGCGTKADVRIALFGSHGDTGDRPITKSRSHSVPFQRSQLDVFYLESIDLGQLSRIRIGHNGTALGTGWYLENVFVKVSEKAEQAYKFTCNRWLSSKEGDGQTVRDILLDKEIPVSEIPPVKKSKDYFEYRRMSLSSESGNSRPPSRESRSTVRRATSFDVHNSANQQSATGVQKLSAVNEPAIEGEVVGVVNVGGERKKQLVRKRSTSRHRTSTEEETHSTSSDSEQDLLDRQQEKQKRRARRGLKREQAKPPVANIGGIVDAASEETEKSEAGGQETTVAGSAEQNDDTTAETVSDTVETSEPVEPAAGDEQKVEGPDDTVKGSDDELVEFTNKDTTKKYTEETDDLYMSGFLAGVRATEAKKGTVISNEDKANEEANEKILKGSTIHQACEDGHLDRMRELVSLVPDLQSKKDERGWAPIHISSAYGHIDLVKHLCVMGVDLKDATPTGYTPIHLASMNGHVNCIMILSAMGCPISCRTVDEQTPLHLACMSGHIECVKWLVSNRARISVKEKFDRTPLDLCEEYQHEECAQLLRIMKKDLQRKDSAMSLLRDTNALRRPSTIDEAAGEVESILKGGNRSTADSGNGASNEDEEWLSDTESSAVVGRGGDDRPPLKRQLSAKSGRQFSTRPNSASARLQGSVSSRPPSGRRNSKQEERLDTELIEKKALFTAERRKQLQRKGSFLDSIRMDAQQEDDSNDPLEPSPPPLLPSPPETLDENPNSGEDNDDDFYG